VKPTVLGNMNKLICLTLSFFLLLGCKELDKSKPILSSSVLSFSQGS